MFDCTLDELAEQIAKEPALYTNLRVSLELLQGKGIFGNEVEDGLEKTLAMLDQANEIARDGDYFLFGVYDSWAEYQGNEGNGYVLYKRVNNQFISQLEIGMNPCPPPFDMIVEYCQKHSLTHLFTMDPKKAGLEDSKESPEYTDEDRNDPGFEPRVDVIEYTLVETDKIKPFKEAGITVVYLP